MSFYKSWLFACILCTLLMVFIGGFTRLTNSGLSITEWKPITGIIPPLTEESWKVEMQKYKKTPEFQSYNFNMTMNEFKRIYLIEYFHRLFGRFTGIVFILPFLYFFLTKKLSGKSSLILTFALCLGLLQGFIGWYMVKSGLVDIPHVSHYRLALHLFLAAAIFSLLWYECSPQININNINNANSIKKILFFSYLLLILITVQIILGAFVAGMKAGLIYNTFPLMDGKIIADDVFILKPIWMNFLQNQAGVQFLHRVNGIIIFIFISLFTMYFQYKNNEYKNSEYKNNQNCDLLNFLYKFLLIVLFQVLIGIFTLIYHVPISIALIHQVVAFIVLGFNVTLIKSLRNFS